MFKFIVKNEVSTNLKSPIYWLGIIAIIVGVYISCAYSFSVPVFDETSEFKELEPYELSNAGITDGYIPTNTEERISIAFTNIFENLKEIHNISEAELAILATEIDALSLEDAIEYISEKYPAYSYPEKAFTSYSSGIRLATYEEINDYIDKSLEEETYTAYFSRKVIDFISVFGFIFAVFFIPKALYYDYKKDIYELLHTKSISAVKYTFGKCFGCFATISIAMFIVATAYNIYGVYYGLSKGFSVNVLDIYFYLICFILPFHLFICSASILVATLFKTVISAIPFLFLHFIYSNILTNKSYISGDEIIFKEFFPNLFSLTIRFPNDFFETYVHIFNYVNSAFLVGVSLIFLFLSIKIWERRKI